MTLVGRRLANRRSIGRVGAVGGWGRFGGEGTAESSRMKRKVKAEDGREG